MPDASRRIYEAVLEAQQAAIDAAGRPEVTTGEVDAAARDTLARHGLDGVFGHGTGHGLGLDVHEAPRLSRRSADAPGTDRLEAGMVFTIEPGAYVEARAACGSRTTWSASTAAAPCSPTSRGPGG